MDTTFVINAHKWTQKSIDSLNEKKYFQSWLNIFPAKLYYLADVITNVCMTPFSLIKILFGSAQFFYTWGHETKVLSEAIEDLYDYTNNALTSFVGIFSVTLGKSIKNQNNLKKLISHSFIISMFSLAIFAITKADGVSIYYNSATGQFEPTYYWDFHRFSHR